ncbi:MAG: hypothetical protein U0798_06780 [Gemmataceae bacterium]
MSTGTTEEKLNKIFWKNYIDYVLGINSTYSRERFLAGNEQLAWPEGSSVKINKHLPRPGRRGELDATVHRHAALQGLRSRRSSE